MASPVWQLDQHNARLQLAQLAAAIDLARPDQGLIGVGLGPHSLDNARLLAVDIPSLVAGDAESLVECHVRNSDLAAVYKESANWPVRADARWRAVAPPASNGPLAAIELVVAVRTQLLNARPEVSVQTDVPAAEVLQLLDEGTARFKTLGREGPCVVEPRGGTGCLLFRLPQGDLSYAEMVHPADFLEDRLQAGTDSDQMVRLRHRLFQSPLEKGVILLARVAGVFLRQSDDTRVAAEYYAAFASAEPPLGT